MAGDEVYEVYRGLSGSDKAAPTDRQILELERRYSFSPRRGVKEQAIRDAFDVNATEFYRRLVVILADPDPQLAVEFPALFRSRRARLARGMNARLPRTA